MPTSTSTASGIPANEIVAILPPELAPFLTLEAWLPETTEDARFSEVTSLDDGDNLDS